MILIWLILIPLIGGLLAWLVGHWHGMWSRWVGLVALSLNLVLTLTLWLQATSPLDFGGNGLWLATVTWPWLPQLGITFSLALDGLSLLLILLTNFLGLMAVVSSWNEIQQRVGFFHFNLLWVLAGIVGVFLALDLFLFYFFWEVMLIPMYFLIAIWGHERRLYAAMKFFIYTQLGGLLMLAAIVGLYVIHGQTTGVYTFDFNQLRETTLPPSTALWLLAGFLAAFLIKLPAVPFHNWLPDAHTEAPTAGSVILAGLLLKTGAYGLLRFGLPLFPTAVATVAPVAMLLGAVGILYGALLAFAQTDLKRLVAYTSVSHMGFVLLGVFAQNRLAWQGAMVQMLAHGISTGALFILVGALQERTHTRDLTRLGGLWASVPRMGAVAMLFVMASLGLPGLGNFVGEILVLMGAYQTNVGLTVLATVGLVLATVYSLRVIQRTFHGPNQTGWQVADFSAREMVIMAAMVAVIVWLGLYPKPVMDTTQPVFEALPDNSPAQMTEANEIGSHNSFRPITTE